jgi:hypothetical protein
MSGIKTIQQMYSGSPDFLMLIDLAWGLAYDAVGDNHSADTEAPCLKDRNYARQITQTSFR